LAAQALASAIATWPSTPQAPLFCLILAEAVCLSKKASPNPFPKEKDFLKSGLARQRHSFV
jgi:hypothetical protein